MTQLFTNFVLVYKRDFEAKNMKRLRKLHMKFRGIQESLESKIFLRKELSVLEKHSISQKLKELIKSNS